MKNLSIFFLIFSAFALLTSCEELENNGLTANAGPDLEASVGVPVTLNSNASLDMDGNGYMVLWSFESLPQGSSASINNPGAESTTFTPDMEGEYVVKLTISNNIGEDSDEVKITALITGALELAGSYTEPLVLTNLIEDPTEPDYVVTGDVSIYNELSIEPGVRIEFMSDKRMYIDDDGWIKAEGTATDPIVFTGTSELAGFWKGISLQSTNLENVMNHVHIRSAGSSNIGSGRPLTALHLETARISVSNSVFSDNAGYGISVWNVASSIAMAANSFSNNGAGAMYITTAQINNIDSQTNFNDQEVLLAGGTLDTDQTHTWRALQNGAYRFTDDVTIYDDVTIEAGAIFIMNNEVRLWFDDDSSIKSLGTEQMPVEFRGYIDLPGAWKGISLNSPNIQNIFEHTHFYHAGHSVLQSGYGKTAIGFGNGARATFSNCTFNNIDGYGLYMRYDNLQVILQNNTFGNNISEGAIYMLVSNIKNIDVASDFGGTYVVVDGGTVAETDDVSWPKLLNGKYLFTDDVNLYGRVVVQPGSILEFDSDVRIWAQGPFLANGTNTEPITFTRKAGSAVHWRGIVVVGNSIENSLDYVNISYGGNNNLASGYDPANLGVANNGRLSLTNSTISNSLGYGVSLRNGADFTETGNTFTANATGDINQQ